LIYALTPESGCQRAFCGPRERRRAGNVSLRRGASVLAPESLELVMQSQDATNSCLTPAAASAPVHHLRLMDPDVDVFGAATGANTTSSGLRVSTRAGDLAWNRLPLFGTRIPRSEVASRGLTACSSPLVAGPPDRTHPPVDIRPPHTALQPPRQPWTWPRDAISSFFREGRFVSHRGTIAAPAPHRPGPRLDRDPDTVYTVTPCTRTREVNSR
jgi:hypothetical protein